MSETEATNSVADNEETPVDTDDPKTEDDTDAEKEEVKTPDESKPSEPEEKSSPSNEELEKKCSDVEVPAKKPTTTSDQTKSGECNLLPVLVERLRSALEQSCSSQSSEDPLPLEDSGVDSEEDLRMWASGLCNSIEQNNQSPKALDLKFLEDLLLSDIQTALSRLQDTLKRVDVNTLTKYNSTLDSTNKLHLLRLISNLLSRLKIPEELTAKPENSGSQTSQGTQKRRRANRHTIGVSAEEIAHARKLMDEKNLGSAIPDSTVEVKPIEPEISVPDKPVESIFAKPVVQSVSQAPVPQPEQKPFEQVRDKHVKDAINQQQTYYNKNKEFYKEKAFYHPPPPENHSDNLNRMEVPFKDESFSAGDEEYGQQSVPSFYQQPIASKYNKFGAKKSKIKRANTIDIPNYMKLQADNFGQNQAISLRRPIDIGDRNTASNANIIPAFKPKTDNDRKFLALINKNNDAAPSRNNLPFKSFNYRQPDNIDKNWNSRFSNIKTTFDKPSSNFIATEESGRPNADSSRTSQSGASDSGESEGVVVGSLRLAYAAPPPKQKQGGFTHAPTSPFQRIEKPSNRNENASIFKSGYLPKGGSSLQAKVKIFNQDNSGPPSVVAQNRNKFNKISDQSQYGNSGEHKPGKLNQLGNFSYNPGYKPNSDSNKTEAMKQDSNTIRSYLPGNRNVISSKLIVNAKVNDEEIGPKAKTQYPYSGRSANTGKNKTDTAPSNEERNSYGQFQSANSYPEKLYSGYSSRTKNTDVPARTSSHSFMLQKIANDNNHFDIKPKVNRYVNEALKIKDNKDVKEKAHPPLTSHYVKPAPPVVNYSTNEVPLLENRGVQSRHVVQPAQNYTTNNNQNMMKSSLREFNPQKAKISNSEYKPIQNYSTHDAAIRFNEVSNQANPTQDTKLQSVEKLTQNFSGNYSRQQNKEDGQFYGASNHRNPSQNLKANLPIEPNYETRSFPKSFDASSGERYAAQPTNDVNTNQPRGISNKVNSLQDEKLNTSQYLSEAYNGNTERFPIQVNSITGKVQGDYNQGLAKNHPAMNKHESNYTPYQSYQTKRDNDHPRNYQESNYHNADNSGSIQNERLQSYGNLYNEFHPQNQTIQSSLLEENNSDKEIQMYSTEPDTVSSGLDFYQQKDMILEDENIQNQDISSEGIVTRYQCAIATVATTPESSEADLNEVSFPNPKMYNLKIAAYPIEPREQSQVINANYEAYDQKKTPVKPEPQNEASDESSDAFEEIQRHNLLQQQIIQKLQNDENSGKNVRRRSSLEKFKWEEKSPTETVDRRSSFYEKFKTAEDRSPTSPLPHFPFNRPSTPPKQTEEPVIECNNTLEKISIFEEKSLQPLPSATRQRFRPLSIPKFDKSKDFQPPKINVVIPSKVVKPNIIEQPGTIINGSTNMCDSSDEYLMSCANKQSRSIVLSKSESWHQLALSRGNLQLPQPATNHLLKPPKPKSPASLKLSKQYEASSSADNMKRMEEKIQRYFHSPTNVPNSESSSSKRESKSRRHFSSKKNQSSTGLARSQTMPHLYDEKLLDESTDVEKAFDSLFKEATKSDNRY